MNETTQQPESDHFVIWSIAHDAWWGPPHLGYTLDLYQAGRYPRCEAEAIVRQANIVAINECMIPLTAIFPAPDKLARLEGKAWRRDRG